MVRITVGVRIRPDLPVLPGKGDENPNNTKRKFSSSATPNNNPGSSLVDKKRELVHNADQVQHSNGYSDGLKYNREAASIELSINDVKHEFTFDKIFSETSTQEDIFASSATTIIDNVLEGYNGCIFAYGQTGAGMLKNKITPYNFHQLFSAFFI